jgi:hypothetical protein
VLARNEFFGKLAMPSQAVDRVSLETAGLNDICFRFVDARTMEFKIRCDRLEGAPSNTIERVIKVLGDLGGIWSVRGAFGVYLPERKIRTKALGGKR